MSACIVNYPLNNPQRPKTTRKKGYKNKEKKHEKLEIKEMGIQ